MGDGSGGKSRVVVLERVFDGLGEGQVSTVETASLKLWAMCRQHRRREFLTLALPYPVRPAGFFGFDPAPEPPSARQVSSGDCNACDAREGEDRTLPFSSAARKHEDTTAVPERFVEPAELESIRSQHIEHLGFEECEADYAGELCAVLDELLAPVRRFLRGTRQPEAPERRRLAHAKPECLMTARGSPRSANARAPNPRAPRRQCPGDSG